MVRSTSGFSDIPPENGFEQVGMPRKYVFILSHLESSPASSSEECDSVSLDELRWDPDSALVDDGAIVQGDKKQIFLSA